jgi:hypothetical protein
MQPSRKRKVKVGATSKVLLFITWAMEAGALCGPILALLPDSHPWWIQNPIFAIVAGLQALFFFVVYILSKVFYIPCGFAICAVILRSDIKPIIKFLTAAIGLVASVEVVRWAATVKFS